MAELSTDFGTPSPACSWRSEDRDLSAFRQSLPEGAFGSLVEAVRRSLDAGRAVESLTIEDLPLGGLADAIASVRAELTNSSGFVILDGIPVDELSIDETERVFWGIGLGLGLPVSQSVMGERLGHVRDVTATDPNARAYRNKSELTPHSDPADLLTFLCIHPAAIGGVSRFVSSMAIHEEMKAVRPDLLARLYRGFRYHRLGEQRPDSLPITEHRVPVFSECEGFTSCRYVRVYFEEAAADDPTIEITDLDREAIEMFEALAADPALHHEFALKSGEAVFANNFTVLHARSGFENDPALPPRHLLRLWLSTDPKRPIQPEVLHFDGEPGVPSVEGRTPSYAIKVSMQ
jgi:hypothetical protein